MVPASGSTNGESAGETHQSQGTDLLPVPVSQAEQTSELEETFWSLAKNGTAAWGHEPSVDEISGYWQELLADTRAADQPGAEIESAPDGEGWDEAGLYGDDGLYYTDEVYGDVWMPPRPEPPPWEPPEVVDWSLPGHATALRALDPDDLLLTGRGGEPQPWEPPEVVDWLPLRSGDEVPQTELEVGWWEAAGDEVPDGGRPDPWSGPDPTPEALGWLRFSPRAVVSAPDSRSEADAPDVGATRPVGLAGGGLAYAGALAVLERRRRVQIGHRRSGQAVPLPPAPLDAYERELRQGADVTGANLVDVALRAAATSAGPIGLPRLALVEVGSDQVRLAVPRSGREPVPEGFTLLGSDDRYGWATGAEPDELISLAAPALAPAPALVPFGVTQEGDELLVDLEAVGVVSIDGAPNDVLGLLRSAALALATAAWSDGVSLVVVGLERELQDLPDVVHVGTLQDALALAERHTERVALALETQGHSHTGVARGALASNEAHDVLAVVSALAPQDEETWQRVMALSSYRRRGVGLLVPNLVPVGVKVAEVGRLDTERGTLRIPGVLTARQLFPRRLDAVDLRGLMGLLASVAEPAAASSSLRLQARTGAAGVSAARSQDAVPTGDQVRDEASAHGEVLVRVLGTVEAVRVLDGSEHRLEPITAGALELLAYLALRAAPVTDGTIEVNLFPDGAGSTTVGDLVGELRRLLGPDAVYRWAAGRLALSERIVTDYSCLCDLVTRAEASPDPDEAVEHLTAALELVAATPLNGVGQRFPWAGPQRMVMTAQVLDAADALAELRADEHEWLALEWAAYQGLKVAPADERMHWWLMRAAQARGDVERIHELFADLCDLVADPVVGLEPEDTVQAETMQLMEQLLSQAPPPARRGLPGPPAAAVTTELPQVDDEELPITREVPRLGPDDEADVTPPSLLHRP